MPKIEMQGSELQNVSVNFVSLVKRGANRLPFRIVKEDNSDMIDLSKISRAIFKKADKGPRVIAVLLNKSELITEEEITALLMDCGLGENFLKTEDGDNVAFLAKGEEADDTTGILKLNDNVALAVTGLKKGFSSWDYESTSFSDILASGTFYPGFCMAQDMLQSTLRNIMDAATEPGSAAELITKACDEFKSYVGVLASAIPVHAFKADVAVQKAFAGKDPEADKKAKAMADAAAKEAADLEAKKKKETKKADAPVVEVNVDVEGDKPQVEAPKEEPAKEEPKTDEKDPPKAEPAQKTEEQIAAEAAAAAGTTEEAKVDPSAELLKSVQEMLSAGFTTISEQFQKAVADVKTEVESVNSRVGALSATVQKTEEALHGTVAVTAAGDRTGVQKTEQSDESKVPPLLDTAYSSRAA